MTTAQQLVSVDDISQDNAPLIYVEGGLKPFIEQVRAEVSAEVPDLSTKKGRDRIASLAAKVSKSKAAVEKPGRDYLRKLKAMPKVVETELREFVQSMDALRDETRRPLTEWEQAEEARVAALLDRVQQLKDFADPGDLHAAGIQVQIENLEAIAVGESFEEFEPEAHRVKAASLAALREALVNRQQYEAEQAVKDAEAKAQAAAEAERQRQADEQARIEAEAKAREADIAHKTAILTAIKESFMQAGVTEEQAKAIVNMIRKGDVPSVSIQY